MTTRVVTYKSAAEVRQTAVDVRNELVEGRSAWAINVLTHAADELATEIKREYALKAYLRTDDAGIQWDESKAAKERGGLTMIETSSTLHGIGGQVEHTNGTELVINVLKRSGCDRDPTRYFKFIFEGTKNADGTVKIPPRPTWPTDGKIPDSYVRAMNRAILPGIADEIARRIAA